MVAPESSVLDSGFEETFGTEARVAFPKLTNEQTKRAAAIAKECELADGEVLWEIGDRAASFYVVLEGAVDICQPLPGGGRRLVVRHGPGGFTGDIDLSGIGRNRGLTFFASCFYSVTFNEYHRVINSSFTRPADQLSACEGDFLVSRVQVCFRKVVHLM